MKIQTAQIWNDGHHTVVESEFAKWYFSPNQVDTASKRGAKSGVSLSDILFECPICNKSMVAHVSFADFITDCMGCGRKVIVPPVSVRMILEGYKGGDDFPNVIN